jgi:DNA-directed RNA polymerase subunit RPC12/RpoP
MKHFLFKIRTACTECGEPLILDGPIRRIQCLACQSPVEIDGSSWKRILEWRKEDKVRKRVSPVVLGFASEFAFHMRMGPQTPQCAACSKALDLASVDASTDGEIACACGHATPVFPAPEWLRSECAQAVQIIGGAREDGAAKTPVAPAASNPVSFGCPDCGANLKITIESPRILECQYCKADLFLPDPLWRALHPVKKRSAWYVAFST